MTRTAARPIDRDLQGRFQDIGATLRAQALERESLIEGLLVALVAQLHLVMLGPAGVGKSFLINLLMKHISDARHFETSLNGDTEVGQILGEKDVKAFVETGASRRVTQGMLPWATHATIDEFFNANGLVLKAMQPLLNEREYDEAGTKHPTDLRNVFAGTNVFHLDADLMPMFDRLHLRYTVDYLKTRQNRWTMVEAAMKRIAADGRGSTSLAAPTTTVTVAELDQAHQEAMALEVPDSVALTFLDIHEELVQAGIRPSERKVNDGMQAVLASAWVRGHDVVQAGDLDILANMWWVTYEDVEATRQIVLSAANPGEKVGLDLLDTLDKIAADINGAKGDGIDPNRLFRAATQAQADLVTTLNEAETARQAAVAAGHSTNRLDQVVGRVAQMRAELGRDVYGIPIPAGV